MIDAETVCPICEHDIRAHGDTPGAEHICAECADHSAITGRTWTCGMTAADIRHALTPYAEPDCRTCGGTGEVRHPRWGASSCPEPTTVCPTCKGDHHA